jgi:hypothetical protein
MFGIKTRRRLVALEAEVAALDPMLSGIVHEAARQASEQVAGLTARQMTGRVRAQAAAAAETAWEGAVNSAAETICRYRSALADELMRQYDAGDLDLPTVKSFADRIAALEAKVNG